MKQYTLTRDPWWSSTNITLALNSFGRILFSNQLLATCVRTRPVTSLGHQEGRQVFWEGPKILIMSNSFKLCPTYFSRGVEKFCRGCFATPGYGPGAHRPNASYTCKNAKALFFSWTAGCSHCVNGSLRIWENEIESPETKCSHEMQNVIFRAMHVAFLQTKSPWHIVLGCSTWPEYFVTHLFRSTDAGECFFPLLATKPQQFSQKKYMYYFRNPNNYTFAHFSFYQKYV